MIPSLIDIGNPSPYPVLPPGIHIATLDEIRIKFAITPHRKDLFNGFNKAAISLVVAGCQQIFLDGSFTTGKTHPEDFDGCWDPTGVDPKKLDPVLLNFDNLRQAQKMKYGGELFISGLHAIPNMPFLDFFQTDRHSGKQKGILSVQISSIV